MTLFGSGVLEWAGEATVTCGFLGVSVGGVQVHVHLSVPGLAPRGRPSGPATAPSPPRPAAALVGGAFDLPAADLLQHRGERTGQTRRRRVLAGLAWPAGPAPARPGGGRGRRVGPAPRWPAGPSRAHLATRSSFSGPGRAGSRAPASAARAAPELFVDADGVQRVGGCTVTDSDDATTGITRTATGTRALSTCPERRVTWRSGERVRVVVR